MHVNWSGIKPGQTDVCKRGFKPGKIDACKRFYPVKMHQFTPGGKATLGQFPTGVNLHV